MLRTVAWLFRIVVFLLLLGLAIKNSGSVTLHFFFSEGWEFPLVLVMLVCFGVGAVLGATLSMVSLYRQRREIEALRRQIPAKVSLPPAADVAPIPSEL